MKSLLLFLIFGLSLITITSIDNADAQANTNTFCTGSLMHCYATHEIFSPNIHPLPLEPNTGNRYTVTVPDLNIQSPDVCVEDVLLVTQWVRFEHFAINPRTMISVHNNYWMEIGVTEGSHDIDTLDLTTRTQSSNNPPTCISKPSIYYGINDNIGYREFVLSNPITVGEEITFSVEDLDNDGTWQIKSTKSQFPHAQISQSTFKQFFTQNDIGIETTIPGDRYSSVPPTHFKNIQIHRDGNWENWSGQREGTVSRTQSYDIKKCGSDNHLLAGSATNLDCSRNLARNSPPVALDASVTVTGSTQLRLEGTDFDYNYLQFYIEEFPTKGTLTHSNKQNAISNSTGTYVLLDYTPVNIGTDTLKFRTTDSRSNDIGTITITNNIEGDGENNQICLFRTTTCFNDLQSLCSENPNDNRCDGFDTTNFPPQVTVIPVTSGQSSGSTITLSSSATDANNDALTYSWMQINTNAPEVQIINDDMAEASFVIPQGRTASTVNFAFQVIVSDGTTTTMKDVIFTANITKAPPVIPPTRMADPQVVETILFDEQFTSFTNWNEGSEWDIERAEDTLPSNTNNKVAHIEECDNT